MLLSIMPKTYLHELFADHEDTSLCYDSPTTGPCIHQQGFNCQQAELVVPVSYVSSDNDFTLSERKFFIVASRIISFALLQVHICEDSDRGPPVLV